MSWQKFIEKIIPKKLLILDVLKKNFLQFSDSSWECTKVHPDLLLASIVLFLFTPSLSGCLLDKPKIFLHEKLSFLTNR